MGVAQKLPWHNLQKFVLDLADGLAGGQSRAIGDAEDVCIDGYRWLSESRVEHDVCSFAANSG